MTRRTYLGAAAVGAALLLWASAEGGSAQGRSKGGPPWVNTFEGSCRLSGEFRFAQPIGNLPRETSFTDDAAGSCSGTLDGTPLTNVPVVNQVRGSGTLSCLADHTSTADTLTFARRWRIHIFVDAAGGLTQFVGHFRGAVSGDGAVEVNFLPYADQGLLAACQTGALHTARYDLVARTFTPLVG